MTLINVFVERYYRYIMNITAFMISYHHSVLVLTIYDLRAIHLNYLGVKLRKLCASFCMSVEKYRCNVDKKRPTINQSINQFI